MRVRFSADDAGRAYDEWGANCGPGALAGVMGMTLAEVRPHMGDFERKRYTNPTLMFDCLARAGARWTFEKGSRDWPRYGLARIQWEGPWTKPGVPPRVAYRHTHWVGSCVRSAANIGIFDINCMESGGWVSLSDWETLVVPWLLKETEPKADGRWHITHAIEVTQPPI
jgi:hypothetical protein